MDKAVCPQDSCEEFKIMSYLYECINAKKSQQADFQVHFVLAPREITFLPTAQSQGLNLQPSEISVF